jgi:hypothetical protein
MQLKLCILYVQMASYNVETSLEEATRATALFKLRVVARLKDSYKSL